LRAFANWALWPLVTLWGLASGSKELNPYFKGANVVILRGQ